MPSDALSGLMANPLTLPAFLAGALTVLAVGLLFLLFRRASTGRRAVLSVAALSLAGIALIAILDRMARDERSADRRAWVQRNAQLTVQALAPGSALGCLDDIGGETVGNACEKTVFAGPQATSGAVAYMAARLTLLAEAHTLGRGDAGMAATLAGARRAVEADRFGVAAHVLAVRDGCTAERCAAFAWLSDANVIKSNLKAQLFDQYVSRYAADWNKGPGAEKQTPVASLPEQAPPEKTPVAGKYDFPSAASIPAVSIMGAEPPLPKEAVDAQAAQTPIEGNVPVPPKRPAQAPPPPAR